ncbi:TIR domain-containing protein [Mycolicibacterium sp. BiH015]|uniref:nSTAND1 domain-containing NTPase n=1 Tax=Mycolicibacterium sp. BiH015 TaxID=3018808 RepID=UPI0022E5AE55|nr:TIR domain-containing protein [Mycolicibacterium sp. BiH015]MDA2891294.1 TIR domain-containing protein [Mycolicibacterium sp. BiH015]
MSRIFLSHSSRNTREAIALKLWLASQDRSLATEIFLDVDPDTGIPTGARWREALQAASARCEAVICLLSPEWAASIECRLEYDTAVALNKRIFCARLGPSAADEVTAQFQRCDLFGGDISLPIEPTDAGPPVAFSADGLYRLFQGIKGAGISADSFHWPPVHDPARAPYRGWEPLSEADAAVFFGRDAELVQGLDALRGMRKDASRQSLFIVLGPSGVGKSSFLRAGLLPRLRRDDRNFTLLDIVRPERAAISGKSALAASIHSTRHRLGLSEPAVDDIAAACTLDPDRVRNLLEECRMAAERRIVDRESTATPTTLVLPLDQAEELFTTDAGPEATQFLHLIAMLADPLADNRLIVAATIRTDRYEAMQTASALSRLQTLLFDNLKPMPTNRFKEVIEGPAKRATQGGYRLEIDPALVARLLTDSTEGADTLPMLSLTLAWLFAHHGSSGRLTLQHYADMGGMDRVLQNEIDSCLDANLQRRAWELEQLRSAFIPWLATINPQNDQPMRRIARYVDLPDGSRPMVDRLIERRLIVSDRQADGTLSVEVALESLLRQWDDLAGWLRDQRKDLKAADDLERAATGWQAAGRDDAWLLAGARLADAEKLAQAPGFRQRLGDAHEFLWASREAANRRVWQEDQRKAAELNAAKEKQATAESHAAALQRRQQVLRRVLVATAVVAVVAIIGGAVAVVSFRQAATARDQAQYSLRQATVAKLKSEARAVLAQTADGSDVEAYEKILAAYRIESIDNESPDTTAILDALTSQPSTRKIVPTPETDRMFALSSDRSMVVRGANDLGVRRYETETGALIGEPLEGHTDVVFSVAISPDGALIASGSADSTVRLWSSQTGEEVRVLDGEHTDAVLKVAFSPDGRRLVSTGRDNTAILWDVDSGTPIRRLTGHSDRILGLSFSPVDPVVATGSYDGTARLWNSITGEPLGEPITGPVALSAVTFSPDGKRLAAGGDGSEGVWMWDIADRRLVVSNVDGHIDAITDVAYSPDGTRLLSTGLDGRIVIRDVDTGAAVCQPLVGHTGRVYNAVFAPDGASFMTAGEDATVRSWDIRAGCLVGSKNIYSAAFPPEADLILTGHSDGSIRRWKRSSGTRLPGVFAGHTGPVARIASSPDGALIASVSEDGTVRLWNGTTQTQIGPNLTDVGMTTSVAFSPNGRRLITAGDDFVTVRDGRTGTPIRENPIEKLYVSTVAFSPDGTRFAMGGGDNTVRIMDAETAEPIGDPFTDHSGLVWKLAFSPDNKTLASAGLDRTVRLYDIDEMEQIGSLGGHFDETDSLAFNNDGTRLATGTVNNEVRLWDVASLTQIGASFAGHTNSVLGLAFDPDDPAILLTASGDGSVRRWATAADPEALCARLTSNVGHREWNEMVSIEIDFEELCDELPVPPQ